MNSGVAGCRFESSFHIRAEMSGDLEAAVPHHWTAAVAIASPAERPVPDRKGRVARAEIVKRGRPVG